MKFSNSMRIFSTMMIIVKLKDALNIVAHGVVLNGRQMKDWPIRKMDWALFVALPSHFVYRSPHS